VARKRVADRARRALPLILSFVLVAALAAGLGYVMGLFLTGALGSEASQDLDAEPGPGAPPPAGGDQPPAADGGAGAGIEPPGETGGSPGQDGQPPESGARGPQEAGPGPETAGSPAGPPGDEAAGEEAAGGEAGGGEPPGETPVEAAPVALYVIQVGVFSSLEGAQAALDQVRAAGFDGAIAPGGDGYRVWTGLFTSREQGRPLAGAMADAGFETFIAEHTVGGSGLLRGGSQEARQVLREHLEALPGRVQRMAAALESGAGIAPLAAELQEAEAQLGQVQPGLDLEDPHESLRRLYAQMRRLLQEAAAGFDALPVLAGAPEAAVEAAAILAALSR